MLSKILLWVLAFMKVFIFRKFFLSKRYLFLKGVLVVLKSDGLAKITTLNMFGHGERDQWRDLGQALDQQWDNVG